MRRCPRTGPCRTALALLAARSRALAPFGTVEALPVGRILVGFGNSPLARPPRLTIAPWLLIAARGLRLDLPLGDRRIEVHDAPLCEHQRHHGGQWLRRGEPQHPRIGALLGHGYPQSPSFGVAPCPTTIFTFGLLLWTDRPVPRPLLVIPLLWSLLGVSAAVSLGIKEDLGLVVAALLGTALLIWRDRPTGWVGALRRKPA